MFNISQLMVAEAMRRIGAKLSVGKSFQNKKKDISINTGHDSKERIKNTHLYVYFCQNTYKIRTCQKIQIFKNNN